MTDTQGNFEKLTREELVIIEAENVLQPAAVQKVFMVIGMIAIVMMMMMIVMLVMAMMMMMKMVQMLTLHNAVSKLRPPEISLDEVCARSSTS